MNISANRHDRRSLDSPTPGMSGGANLHSCSLKSLSRAVLQLVLMSSVAICHAQVSSDVNTASEQRSASTVAKRAEARVGSTEISKPSVTEQMQAPAPSNATEPHPRLEGNDIYEKLLRGTVFIACDINEDWSSMSFGTGWLLDKERRIIVTNHHVVARGEEVMPERIVHVYFPVIQDGELLTDRWKYAKELQGIPATIIDTDPSRDLAFLVLDTVPDEAEVLQLSDTPTHPGDRVHELGNPGASDAMWVYTSGTVRQVYRTKTTLTNGQVCEYLRVETQSPTNPGDSGGPVVNDAGEIVAINHASSQSGNLMTYFVDARELKTFYSEAQPWFNPQTAEEYNNRGVHYYDRGRYDKALQDFSQALKLDPMLADAVSNRGWALVQKDDALTALADFDEAIRMNPRDSVYWEGRGLAHASLGKHESSVKDFTEAIRLTPENADLYNNRADARYAAGEFALAIKDYSQAIQLAPVVSDYYNSRGICHAAEGNYPAAIADYTRAIELTMNAVYLYNRGMAHHNNKEYQDAAFDFFQTRQADPEFSKANLQHFTQKVIRIRNTTSETVKVSVKYHTETDKGNLKWYPDAPDKGSWATYTFAPGEESFIQHEEFKVNADRLRLLITNEDGSHVWDTYRDQDYVVCDEGYDAFVMEVHVIDIK
jgi:tetratricopeptide (TPR) repeat protein/S1-C subfamily serine protease